MFNTRTRNRNHGTFLVFACACVLLVAISIVIALSFGSVYFVHNRLQTSADEIALVGAKKLNENDRFGQMNNMVARCRQLVYASREDYDKAKADLKHLESFAEPLLDESRQSARDLETERQRLTSLAQAEADTAMKAKFEEVKSSYTMVLPWLIVQAPQLKTKRFGKMKDMESNVAELSQQDKLSKRDEAKNIVVSYPAMKVYKAEVDEKLDGPDADLSFNLSSLPPIVSGQVAPPRILLNASYATNTAGYAPSATSVELTVKVESKLGFSGNSVMESTGISSTTGSSVQL